MAKYNGNRKKSKQARNTSSNEAKEDNGLVFEGTVVESLRGRFRVEISPSSGSSYEVLAHLAGKLRRFGIKVVPGDKVNVELSPYDTTRGRIVYRLKNHQT